MARVETVLSLAQKELGTTEYPKDSNNVKYNTSFYGREVMGAQYPWCCVFVWYILNKAGVNCLKTASCMCLGDWFKTKGSFKTNNPQAGDIVFFKFSTNGRWTNHVGIVESINKDGSINTIEGNTSSSNKGSQDNGGAVAARVRKSNIVGYGTPVYEKSVKTSQYYPACASNHTSIVDALKSIGVDSSKYMRTRIAEANDVSNYKATAGDNNYMLELLKNGALKKPY